MAYFSQEDKKKLAPAVKAVLKEFGVKATLSVDNHSTFCVNIKEGDLFFPPSFHYQVNVYHYQDFYKDYPKLVKFLDKLIPAMKGPDYFNHDDAMSDYFHRSHYTNVNFGRWDKPYINKGNA